MSEVAGVFDTQVKTYTSTDAYQRDAQKLAAQGWEVSNSAWRQPRSGCMRIILLGGIGALFFKPKDELVVTYRRPKTV